MLSMEFDRPEVIAADVGQDELKITRPLKSEELVDKGFPPFLEIGEENRVVHMPQGVDIPEADRDVQSDFLVH